ncbi:MAG: TetR/AcrR family transcriptional regulator [Alphaproteobacteria bacterium]|nr:TetR/AcrR family transcriptional regulator [Alphaproteobacteria bacterium]
MSQAEIPSDKRREDRRESAHAFKRTEILAAARRVMGRDGAKNLTIRAVAAEAGYVPGAVYFYFHSKAAIISELAIFELSGLTKQLRNTSSRDAAERASAASEAFAAAHTIFTLDSDGRTNPGSERALTGRLISLFQTVGEPLNLEHLPPEQAQARALGLSAAALGLATLARMGRLDKLGVTAAATLREVAHCLKATPVRAEKDAKEA